jgi:ribonucleoside-diphosphate reductase alpha chain
MTIETLPFMEEELKTTKTTASGEKQYSNEEALKGAKAYFKNDELAATVWVNKYALKDSQGNIYENSPEQMHRRLAREFARIEKKYPNPMSEDEIYNLLKDFKYIVPQGSPMAGIGNKYQITSLSNCFVIGHQSNADSYGGIIKMDEEQVQLMKRRGGVGQDLSHIRPKGSPVKNSALTATGIVPFMERYSNSTREVAQDGRRGALMLSVSIKHPDAEDFIDAKLEGTKVTGANVSVRIDDEFMKAVINNAEYQQQYPIDSPNPTFTKTVNARKLWNKIVYNAWKSAEPGILFWDTIINESVPDCYADLGYKTMSTNPCGEIPLCPYDSCRLQAINLYSYVDNPFTPEARFNFEKFKDHVRKGQRLMDDLIDLEAEKVDAIINKIKNDPEDEDIKHTELRLWEKIKEKTLNGRRTGFGITAEGDMIAALGLTYASDIAVEFSESVHKTLAIEAYRSSVEMAKERGAFKIYDAAREKNNPFLNRLKAEDAELAAEMEKYGRRNISLLTIAPTGSTSLMTRTSSGIEPVFQPFYKRRRKVNPNDKNVTVSFIDETGDAWEEFMVYHPRFLTWMEVNGYDVDEVSKLSEEELSKLVEKSPYYKATANDVDWLKKVQMQGRIQKWIDHSISVTINLPATVKPELVGELYEEAWRSGCKGVTVYRDGSRSGVLVSADKKEEKKEENSIFPTKRPKTLKADVVRFRNGSEEWIAFVGLIDGRPYEIFTGKVDEDVLNIPKKITKGFIIKNRDENGKSRYDFQYVDKHGYRTTSEGLSRLFDKEYWNYAKLISGVLRHGMPIVNVINLVSSLKVSSDNINSWTAGVERALKHYIKDGTKAKEGAVCPHCKKENTLVYQEGCLTCSACGYSKCG